MTAPRECRPPEGFDKPEGFFWLRHVNGHYQPAHWFEFAWFEHGEVVERTPAEMAASGWRYVAPCLPPQVGEGV